LSDLQVEDLLAELTSEAQLQSTGRFTVDVSKAKEKLAQFQFQDPFCYILKLVQATVAAGGDSFLFQSGSTELKAALVGVTFSAFELENLLYSLLQESSEMEVSPSLRHLAVAVNAAVGTRASQITLKSWDGNSGIQVTWTSGGQRSSPWQPSQGQGPQTRFELKRLAGDVLSDVYQKVANRDILSMVTGRREGMDREQALIYDHCAFCPIPIKINGKDCPGYDLGAPPDVGLWASLMSKLNSEGHKVEPKHHLLELYFPCDKMGLAGPRKTFTKWAGNRAPGKTYSAILAMPARITGPTLVVPVLDGVSLQVQRIQWPGPASIFYLDAHGLTLDLTEVMLVRNEAALARFNDYAQKLLDAAEQYLASPVAIGRGQLRNSLIRAIQEGRNEPVCFIA